MSRRIVQKLVFQKSSGTIRVISGAGGIDLGKIGSIVPTPELGQPEASFKRASHVLPTCLPLRIAFITIRRLVGDTGRIAAWTRRWECQWQADLSPVGGPVLKPLGDRREAIAAEVAWISERWARAE